jgi:uncharacterized protein YggU (UPF0235/DUF167 family)
MILRMDGSSFARLVRAVPGGVRIAVRVRPRARPRLTLEAGSLVIAVASAPVDGRATEEARRALAAALEVATSAVRLSAGPASRSKVFAVRGVTQDQATERLARSCR